MTPEQLAKPGTEHGHQAALFCWCAANLAEHPELALFHAIPNGGLRSKAQAGKLKAEGVKPGVPDAFLPVARRGFHGLYVEMKKPSMKPKRGGKGGVSDEQELFMRKVEHEDYCCKVCYSWEEAISCLTWYLGGAEMLTKWNLKEVCGTQKFPDMAIVELWFGKSLYFTSSMPTEKAERFIGKLQEGLTVKQVDLILAKGGEDLKHPSGVV